MALKDQPYLPLYVQDVLTDEKLIECSASSQGVYFRLLCILHKQPEYGVFLLKQKYKQDDKQLLNFASALLKPLCFSSDVIYKALTELVDEGVIQIEEDSLQQKRMIKDAGISVKRSQSGSKGGNKTQEKIKKETNFAKAKVQANSKAKVQANSENEIEYAIEYEDELNFEFERKDLSKKLSKIGFDVFWNEYDKKVGVNEKIKFKWDNLKYEDQLAILDYIPKYKFSEPNKKFRKNPESFLNQKSWNDEIIMPEQEKSKIQNAVETYNDLMKPTT